MKTNYVIILLAISTSTYWAECALFIPSAHNVSYYRFPRELLSFSEAKAACEQLDAELVLPKSMEEQAYISNFYTSSSPDRFWVNAVAFLHANNKYIDGNGYQLQFINFAGPPPPCDSTCCAATFDLNLTWSQSDCYQRYRVICQKSSNYSDYYVQDGRGMEYYYHSASMSFHQAESTCGRDGGHLVTVTTANLYTLRALSSNRQFWTGGRYYDNYKNGRRYYGWYWIDGSQMAEQLRRSHYDHNCLYLDDSGNRATANCDTYRPYICQRRAPSTAFLWEAAVDHESRIETLEVVKFDTQQAFDAARDHIMSLIANHTIASAPNNTDSLNNTEILNYLVGIEQRLELLSTNFDMNRNKSLQQMSGQLVTLFENDIAKSSNSLITQLDLLSQSITRNENKDNSRSNVSSVMFFLLFCLTVAAIVCNALYVMKLRERILKLEMGVKIEFSNMRDATESCESFAS